MVSRLEGNQLVVGSAFDDFTIVKNQDLVRRSDGGQAMTIEYIRNLLKRSKLKK